MTAIEPESIERQFTRWAYGTDSQLPYLPASRDPRPRPQRPDQDPPINRVLNALHNAGCTYRPSPQDVDSWGALCPTHDDTRPSLHVKRNHDGTIWFRCWAGCSKEGILHALGLEWRDLWAASEHDPGRRSRFVKPLLPAHLRRAMEDLLRADDLRRAA